MDRVWANTWTGACKRAGVPGFRFHDLRHTWASWHAMAGTPLSVLQELGGWHSHEMVQRYAHLSPEHLANAAERVNF
jgi:integrase